MNVIGHLTQYAANCRAAPRRLAVAALLASAAASAYGTPIPDGIALPPGSTQAVLGKNMRLFGIPVDIRLIEIPLPVVSAAAALTARYPALADLSVHAGWLVLSGLAERNLWLVTLEAAGPQRTRGTAASFELSGIQQAQWSQRPGWLPPQAQLRMDFSAQEPGLNTQQQIWMLPMPVAQAREFAARGLRRLGWQVHAADLGIEHWQRDNATLDITYVATDGGSGLLLQKNENITP